MYQIKNTFHAGFGRLASFALLGLVLLSSLVSCETHYKTTMYQIAFGIDKCTQPQNITDPDVRQTFDRIIAEFEKAHTGLDDWTVEVVNDRYEAEDKNAVNRYNETLTRVKAVEAECRRILAGLEAGHESSFFINASVTLTRWVAVDHLTTHMQEYNFELKYNQ